MNREASFDSYLSEHRLALQRFANALAGDPRLAEDVVQDVLLKAFQRWDSIRALEQPHAYVRRMVVNEHLSWRRRWSRTEPHAQVEPRGAVTDTSDAYAERASLVSEVVRLPKRQRAVLAMRYFADMSDTDIAGVLDCSAATVRSIASRALAKLRIQMSADTSSLREQAAEPATNKESRR